MARTKKYTPEETLRSLYNLQFIDSRIDTMREVRGELPMEVSDLEDEMVGLTKRLEKIEEQTGDLNQLILEKKNIPIMFIGEDVRDKYIKLIPPMYPEFFVKEDILSKDLVWNTNDKFRELGKYIWDNTD